LIASRAFTLYKWGHEMAEHDPYARFTFGVPPRSKGDYAFIQHMLATTNATGRVGVVVAHGVLFRSGSEGQIRTGLIKADLLEAVIGLAPNLFYGTGIPGVVLIFNRAKPVEKRDKVLFIDASGRYIEGKNQNALGDQHIADIVEAYKAFEDREMLANVVTVDELAENDYNLNISRYVSTAAPEVTIDVAAELKKLRELEAVRAEAEKRMNGYLRALGLQV